MINAFITSQCSKHGPNYSLAIDTKVDLFLKEVSIIVWISLIKFTTVEDIKFHFVSNTAIKFAEVEK